MGLCFTYIKQDDADQTLRCDAGTVVLFNDPHARGVTRWFATVPGQGTQHLAFRWVPSTTDLGRALYRMLRPLSA